MRILKSKNYINVEQAEYYVESVEELDDIPEDALEGSIALLNDANGLKLFMKNKAGNWNEL